MMKEVEFMEAIERRTEESRRLETYKAHYLAHKQSSRARVTADVEAFLAKGGTIEQVGNSLPRQVGNFRSSVWLRGGLEPHPKK